MKMLGIVAVGVVRESRTMYRAHCAVIFAIAQLSCIRCDRKVCKYTCITWQNIVKSVISCGGLVVPTYFGNTCVGQPTAG